MMTQNYFRFVSDALGALVIDGDVADVHTSQSIALGIYMDLWANGAITKCNILKLTVLRLLSQFHLNN